MPKLALAKHLAKTGRVLDVSFAIGANRLIVSRGGQGSLLLNATSGEEIAKLPEDSSLSAIDPSGKIAAVSESGKDIGGRYTWDTALWDLTKGKKLASLGKSTPDDSVSVQAFGATRVLAIRKKKDAYSVCLFDHAGRKVAEHGLGKVPHPFHAALSPDEHMVAHAYFTGAAELFDLATGKGQKLSGGTLRIGRQHEKGLSSLGFTPDQQHVFYISHGSGVVHLWNVRTRRSVAGAWSKSSLQDAWLFGKGLALLSSGSQDAKATLFTLSGKPAPRTINVGERLMCFADAGDGRHLACAANTGRDAFAKTSLELWDLTTGKRAAKGTVPAAMKAVSSIAACPGKLAVGDVKNGVALFTW